MKKLFAVFVAVILLPGYTSFAWIGGPFSQNSYFTNGDDGIYEAIATMSNGLGMYRFAVRNNGVSGEAANGAVNGLVGSNVLFNGGILQAVSTNVWFYKGITYIGPCFGTASTEMGIVTAVGNAESNAPSNNPTTTTGVNGITIAGPVGNNIQFANSQFSASIKQKYPIVRFSGAGTIHFVGAADTRAEDFDYDPPGLPSGFDLATSLTTTGGERSGFQNRGHRRKFIVFGTKVSHRVLPGG